MSVNNVCKVHSSLPSSPPLSSPSFILYASLNSHHTDSKWVCSFTTDSWLSFNLSVPLVTTMNVPVRGKKSEFRRMWIVPCQNTSQDRAMNELCATFLEQSVTGKGYCRKDEIYDTANINLYWKTLCFLTATIFKGQRNMMKSVCPVNNVWQKIHNNCSFSH